MDSQEDIDWHLVIQTEKNQKTNLSNLNITLNRSKKHFLLKMKSSKTNLIVTID
jgi:hypothetical protein